jgi:four helix bundle protein
MGKYDLEERTLRFSENLAQAPKKIPITPYNRKAILQVMDSGTSIGANYMEANGAESKNDFRHKIRIALKEARETKYWLQFLTSLDAAHRMILDPSLKECFELVLIFAKIANSCNSID